MSVFVRRRDISLDEERCQSDIYDPDANVMSAEVTRTDWIAAFDGRLSTGEMVSISRSGSTFPEALKELESAIADQGWEIR